MSQLKLFVQSIFKQHFKYNKHDFPFNKDIFLQLKKIVIKKIRKQILLEVPDTDYEEYLKNNQQYEVFLLHVLTPFMSNKIKHDILFKYHQSGFFDKDNVSNIYYYIIPNDVVKEICLKNKNKKN
jgi:hypothetical protein